MWTRSEENLGVVKGRNQLIAELLPEADDDDWIVLVDNDIAFGARWREPYDRLLAAAPDAAQINGSGHRIIVRGSRRYLLPLPTVTSPVDVCGGGHCCWVRAGVLRSIGLLDEELGLFWHEDDDLSVRIRADGGLAFAVPEADLTHDLHGSGAALAPWSVGRSLRNQAYLTRKWSEAGWLDEAGWVISPDWRDYVPFEIRRRWLTGGVLGADRRNELSASMWGLRRVLSAEGVELPPPDSLDRAVLRWWAEALRDRTDAERGLGEAAERALRRIPGARPAPKPATDLGGCSIVRATDWSSTRFQSALDAVFPHTYEERQRRDRHRWEAAKMYAAAQINGGFGRGHRALTLGAGCHEIVPALAARVGSLIAVDRYADDARPSGRLPDEPEAVVGARLRGPLPPGLTFRNGDPLNCDLPESAFDLVCAPFLLKWSEGPSLPEGISAIGRLLAPGGLALAALDVAVGSNPPGGTAVALCDVGDAMDSLGELSQVGAFDLSLDDEEFLHTADRQAAGGPVLASNEPWGRGTSAVIVLRRSAHLPGRLTRRLARAKHSLAADGPTPVHAAVGAGEHLRKRRAQVENRRARAGANDPIQMFWAGGPCGSLERLSMRSFLAHGHEVHLYSYSELDGVPPGVLRLDASEFVPERAVESYRQSRQRLSGLANLFRYEMLHGVGGWWMDSDIVCLGHVEYGATRVIGSEPFENGAHETCAAMKMPPGDRITNYLRRRAREHDPSWAGRGTTGPALIAEAVARFGVEDTVVSPEAFCPVGYLDWEQLTQPDGDLSILDGSTAVHVWHEMWNRAGVSSNARFPPTSILEQLRRRYSGGGG